MCVCVNYVVAAEFALGGLETEPVLLALALLRVVRIVSLASLSSRLNHGSSNSLQYPIKGYNDTNLVTSTSYLGSTYGILQPNAIKGRVSLISTSLTEKIPA